MKVMRELLPCCFCDTWDEDCPGESLRELIDLGGHDEIAFRQAIDLMCPERDFRAPPGQQDVGMVSLLFGNFARAVDELQGLPKIRKAELSCEVMLVNYLPLWYLLVQLGELFAFQGRNTTTAGYTGLCGQVSHT